MLKIDTFFGSYDCVLSLSKYARSNNTVIQILYKDEEFDCFMPFATLTVNFEKTLEDCAYIDVNNCPWAEDIIEKYNLGKRTGIYKSSGFCIYPMYKLNLEEIRKYSK